MIFFNTGPLKVLLAGVGLLLVILVTGLLLRLLVVYPVPLGLAFLIFWVGLTGAFFWWWGRLARDILNFDEWENRVIEVSIALVCFLAAVAFPLLLIKGVAR